MCLGRQGWANGVERFEPYVKSPRHKQQRFGIVCRNQANRVKHVTSNKLDRRVLGWPVLGLVVALHTSSTMNTLNGRCNKNGGTLVPANGMWSQICLYHEAIGPSRCPREPNSSFGRAAFVGL